MLRSQLTDRDLHTLRVDGPLTQFVVQHSIYHIYLLLVIKKTNLRQMPQIILRRFLIKRINLLFRADHLYQAATSLIKNPLANSHHDQCYNLTRSIQFIKSKSGINQLVRPEKDKRLNVKTRCSESYRDRGKCLQTFKRVEVGF